MTATEILVAEHRLIKKVLDWGESEIARIDKGQPPDVAKLIQAVDFVRNFADRVHHAKEEGLLFSRLNQRGMPSQGGPIAAMLHEHELGRAYIRGLADALDGAGRGESGALQALRDNLGGYIGLLRAHIDKEDHVLYPMAERLLSREDQDWLLGEFDRLEKADGGISRKYGRLAEEIAALS